MTKKVVSVSPESKIPNIIKYMRKYEISQVPIVDKDNLIGYVSESDVLDACTTGKKTVTAKDIMHDTPPTITKNASMAVISGLLKFYPLVVVIEKGKILGIITKADILRKAYKKGLFS